MAGSWKLITHKNDLPKLAAAAIPFAVQAVQTAAFKIEGEAKVIVPVDTGRLKSSIMAWFANGGLTGLVAPDTEYAIHVEYLNKAYMLPAFRKVEPSFLKAWDDLFKRYQ